MLSFRGLPDTGLSPLVPGCWFYKKHLFLSSRHRAASNQYPATSKKTSPGDPELKKAPSPLRNTGYAKRLRNNRERRLLVCPKEQ